MESIIITLLLFGVLVFLLEPFFTQKELPNMFITQKQLKKRKLIAQKETISASLNELELEYQKGMVSEEDHKALKEDYKKRLNTMINEIEKHGYSENSGNLKKRIEEEIMLRRKADTEIENSEKLLICPKCKNENFQGNKFCSNCGNKLT